jgi:hypothetical protein
VHNIGAFPVKRALANVAAASTDAALAAAPTDANKRIRVVAVACVAGGTATDITFNTKGSGAGTAISCKFANAANGGEVLGYNPAGWFACNQGEALTCTTGAGSTTGVQVVYVEVG